MLAESVHGTLRRLLLEPTIGELPARQISVLTGSLLIFIITLFCIRWIGARSTANLLLIGAMWIALTLMFEVALGTFVFGYTRERIFEDFDPTRGGLMSFGLLFMFFAPLVAARVRGVRGEFESS
jgi:hypothetical protein